jgi:hypothetical protein
LAAALRFYGVRLQIFQGDKLQGRRMRRFEIDGRSDAALQGITPSSNAQAPAISGLQTWESPFGMGRDKVVAIENGEIEEVSGDFNANGMQPGVFGAGATEAVPVKTR